MLLNIRPSLMTNKNYGIIVHEGFEDGRKTYRLQLTDTRVKDMRSHVWHGGTVKEIHTCDLATVLTIASEMAIALDPMKVAAIYEPQRKNTAAMVICL